MSFNDRDAACRSLILSLSAEDVQRECRWSYQFLCNLHIGVLKVSIYPGYFSQCVVGTLRLKVPESERGLVFPGFGRSCTQSSSAECIFISQQPFRRAVACSAHYAQSIGE
jgi:hypothetical protein